MTSNDLEQYFSWNKAVVAAAERAVWSLYLVSDIVYDNIIFSR